MLTSSVSHHSRARTFLITSANVKMLELGLLMRMALAAFRSESGRHLVRGRQSSCAMPRSWHRAARPNPLDPSALSVQREQDHSFATRAKQRTLVKLFGLHASGILVSKSDRRYTTLFTGFASVAPVKLKHPQENSSLLKCLNTLSNSLQWNLSSVVAVTEVDQIVHLRGLVLSWSPTFHSRRLNLLHSIVSP